MNCAELSDAASGDIRQWALRSRVLQHVVATCAADPAAELREVLRRAIRASGRLLGHKKAITTPDYPHPPAPLQTG
jgi:hypothetical protein